MAAVIDGTRGFKELYQRTERPKRRPGFPQPQVGASPFVRDSKHLTRRVGKPKYHLLGQRIGKMDPGFRFKSFSASRNTAMKGLSRSTITARDRQIIAEYLHDAGDDVERCKAGAMRLLAVARTLESRRKGLEKSMKLYRSLLSPIHRMPSEILSGIFMFLCEENELSPKSRRPAAMTLSMVCGRWRDVILSNPLLWSTLSIKSLGSEDFMYSGSPAQITQLFMQRSRDASLKLSLAFRWDFDIDLSLPTLLHLIENCERWFSVDLDVPTEYLEHWAFRRISGRIPRLKRLKLSEDDDYRPADHVMDIFAVAPALSAVDFVSQYPPQNVILPWAQIKTLTLRGVYSEYSLSILEKCSKLEQLELVGMGTELQRIGNREPITLHRVRSLSVTPILDEMDGIEGGDGRFIFQFCTLPRLSSLVIGAIPDEDWAETQLHLGNFLLRSQCNIISLRLQEPGLLDHQIITLLVLLPTLETLHIHETKDTKLYKIVTSFFLRHLTLQHGFFPHSSPLLPRLKNLSVVVSGEGLDTEALADAVVSRWWPAAQAGAESLRSVDITVMGDNTCLRGLSALENFRAAGLPVTIKHIPP
ncbi:hypothetical protein Moror_10811 [Moniliophthora roreri MCA 2997]|uniref:F-box domain-containing protein n=1 Tax=Moniliophthora roreri (strain MCA 2997) TaxID=1381753 RepID=V2X5E0_MONRO|nr:hypothetical protein Moror_10811 [Moniliophthora roreri MCA 2997]